MNANQWLDEAAEQIAGLRPAEAGTFTLYAINGQLGICRCMATPLGSHFIIDLGSKAINDGLTSPQWNLIHARIISLVDKGELC